MFLLFRRQLGLLVCLLLTSFGCTVPPPYHQHSIRCYAPTAAQQIHHQTASSLTAANLLPKRQNPIQQAAYNVPIEELQEPKLLPNLPRQTSMASSDLYKPWNVSEFQYRTSEPQSPYMLVADSQPVPPKTPPPTGGLQQFLAPKAAPVQPQTAVPPNRTTSFPGIGQYFLNEFKPSNDRKWSQNHAVLQTADFHGNQVTIRNVRYSRYESAENYTTQYYDATFNLDNVRTLDLIMVPFRGTPRLAHVESSFGFADGRQIGMSIEARYEEDEKYDPVGAALRQFELVYVFADERDMIRLGADVNNNDVYIYRLKFEPNEVKAMFVDALQRANKLAGQPEFYHPLTNSCVTNLIAHINKGSPKAVPREYRTLIPGLMDNYMYDLKLLVTSAGTFKEAKENAKVNWLVEKYGDLEYFSAGIRQNMH